MVPFRFLLPFYPISFRLVPLPSLILSDLESFPSAVLVFSSFSLSDCGSSAPPQKDNKAANRSNSFCETGYRLEVRVTCTLAIATGVNTVCWVPIITLYAIEKWQNSPLHFLLTTQAL